ncbi:uncharacterized protein IUM83_17655 [Phytophthora cinnamomi]|uniref:uncharacterized protein n=1 Tax=Phytophthora cinnamomi TaxID=4785 RepID=UPI0035594F42|nr:hypothetical protein IUM83_17644 [Phytophthora cinnamomi]KAG6572586.1 hypothetical protein IUM83_17640 [Phytophthora cinnamomi]KAG6572632.1 hypothetical protein IUM83_17636 [Phytophthora cinnamomi]KAG6572639.1 hypothetical protein IUM83_17655 [Phytophthora cinnamomi]
MTLQLQDDDMAIVEEILAFVDTFKMDERAFNECGIADADLKLALVESTESVRRATSASETKPPPKRKRIRTGWSSSTGLQRRKRAELAFLRAHVQELETYLEQLKTRASQPQVAVVANDRGVDWREVALDQFIERKKSEEANRVLKTILDNQTLVGQTLTQVLQQSPQSPNFN